MNREERKSHRRIPPPIIEAHEIQHGQGQEAAPLYAEDPISTEPHDFRNEIPTLEVSLDAQRTPQRSDLSRNPLRSHNPRYSYEHSIQSDSGSIWEDPRALQFEVRKKRRELEEVKRRCIQSESELQNERLKSALLEEENENLRREIRRKERDKSGNQNTEGEIERLKANLANKIKEIELITKELQSSKNEREKLKEHIRVSWLDFEAFKKQSEENRGRLQQTLEEVSANQRFGSQSEAISQITQQKNKIASELQKAEKKIGEMKKVMENLEIGKTEEMEKKDKEIRKLNEIISKQEEIMLCTKIEKEELSRKVKNENKETQTLVERPPEVILPPSTEVEELKPEKVVKIRSENAPDAEEIRESIVEEILPPESEEMKFEFSAPSENYFERISYSDPFIASNNGNKKKKENTSHQTFQPISNLFGSFSTPFEEDINPEITRIPSHDAIKSEEPEIQTWFQEETKENENEKIIDNPQVHLFEEKTNSDYFFSNGPADVTDFFNNVDQLNSCEPQPLLNQKNLFEIQPQPPNQKNLFEIKPQPPQNQKNVFEINPAQKKLAEASQSTKQANQKMFDENIESLFNLNSNPSSFPQYNQNIENRFEIPKAHKSSQSQIITKTSSFMPEPQESAEDFFSNLTNNKNPGFAYGGIPSSLFD
ncbi:unnamed protein product [Blepharisma stoltei]|uniref:Uncharacterized protein n=1 Tax=Blepharisma stoltei TaxID=1481888 RepID=A0AAU9IZN5_9CILI|nr:unnamed protein product [Blepharisma stoltei]